MTFETVDKKKFCCIRNDPAAGHFGGGISECHFTLKGTINAKTGKDVLEVINEAYSDLVHFAKLKNGLFENAVVRKSSIDLSHYEEPDEKQLNMMRNSLKDSP